MRSVGFDARGFCLGVKILRRCADAVMHGTGRNEIESCLPTSAKGGQKYGTGTVKLEIVDNPVACS